MLPLFYCERHYGYGCQREYRLHWGTNWLPNDAPESEPFDSLLKRALLEFEYGIASRSIIFKGIQAPVLLPQAHPEMIKLRKLEMLSYCLNCALCSSSAFENMPKASSRLGKINTGHVIKTTTAATAASKTRYKSYANGKQVQIVRPVS